jgi:hypothetical protein
MPEPTSNPTSGRFARWREHRADRRVLRAERRLRGKGDFQDAARRAEGQAWSKGGYFTKH